MAPRAHVGGGPHLRPGQIGGWMASGPTRQTQAGQCGPPARPRALSGAAFCSAGGFSLREGLGLLPWAKPLQRHRFPARWRSGICVAFFYRWEACAFFFEPREGFRFSNPPALLDGWACCGEQGRLLLVINFLRAMNRVGLFAFASIGGEKCARFHSRATSELPA